MSSRMLSRTLRQLPNKVSVLLEGEKDDMRRWLRAEMDQLVDPLIDRLFDKLDTKLTSALARNELGSCGVQMNPTSINVQNVQVHQSSALNNAQPQPDEIINHKTNQPISQSTQPTNPPSQLISHPSTSTTHIYSFDLTSSSHQVHHNANYAQKGQTNVQMQIEGEFDEFDDLTDNQTNEEDCSMAQNIEQCLHDQQSQANSELMEQELQAADQMETQPIKASNHDKQIITLSLRCLLTECPRVFVQNEDNHAVEQLNHHLFAEHCIGLNRCRLKDCRKTFNNRRLLTEHLNQIHGQITNWQCGKCPKCYTSHGLLSSHNISQHQLGKFQCSFPGCTFIGDYRFKVYSHFRGHTSSRNCVKFLSDRATLSLARSTLHGVSPSGTRSKPKPTIIARTCSQSGCGRIISNVHKLKIHELTHRGFVPYRCKWPNCEKVFSSRPLVIIHLRQFHLNVQPNLSESVFHDPQDYYEMAQDLM